VADPARETVWYGREIMTPQKACTTSGLGRALGVARNTLMNYENPKHYVTGDHFGTLVSYSNPSLAGHAAPSIPCRIARVCIAPGIGHDPPCAEPRD
jgi:hypothetical protein